MAMDQAYRRRRRYDSRTLRRVLLEQSELRHWCQRKVAAAFPRLNDEETYDAVIDACYAVLAACRRVEAAGGSFQRPLTAYLLISAWHNAARSSKAKDRRKAVEYDYSLAFHARNQPAGPGEPAVSLERLQIAFDLLTPDEHRVLYEWILADRSIDAAAALCGVSASTLSRSRRRALVQLRRYFAKCEK